MDEGRRGSRRRTPRAPPRRPVRVLPSPPPPPEPARERFRHLDDYRIRREWERYEGTPLRDLFRELRERFLLRHRPAQNGLAAEIGPGPGRFTARVGHPEDRRVLLDLSRSMLERARAVSGVGRLRLVQGDAVRPPLRPGSFHQVVALGNLVGFAGEEALELVGALAGLVAPGGTLVLETVAGGGERSRYLHRLPPGAVARLLHAPVRAVQPRVEREGFVPLRWEVRGSSGFLRLGPTAVRDRLAQAGLRVVEVLAVAPLLGSDAARIPRPGDDPVAWSHLLELEEAVGRAPARQERAAALLVAAERPGSPTDPRWLTIK